MGTRTKWVHIPRRNKG